MNKKFVAFLLTGILLFCGVASGESVSAAQSEKETVMKAMNEDTPGGYRKLTEVEMPTENLPETYDGSNLQTYARGAAVYKSFWDKYSTNYYYNQLNVNERALWDKLDEMCLGYLTGAETLTNRDHYTSLENGMDFDFYYTNKISYSNLSKAQALDVTSMFVFSNPQYYFLQSLWGSTTLGNTGYISLTVHEDFASGVSRGQATKKLSEQIEVWMAEIEKQPTDILKEKKAHDMICEKVSYDPAFGTLDQNTYNQSIYSVFFTDTTVCAGYSQTMQLLCNGAGINCCVVTSKSHEWNVIEINDTWYYVDCTWDDFSKEMASLYNQEMGYKYFNRSAAVFAEDTDANVRMHTLEDFWEAYLPDLVYDSGATWTQYGTVHEPDSTVSMPQVFIDGNMVRMTAEAGADIYYTVDGSLPQQASAKAVKYQDAFSLAQAATLKVMAVSNGKRDSQTFCASIPVMQRKGYALLGCYTNENVKITGNMPLANGSTIYAKWAKIKGKKASIVSLKNKKKKTVLVKIKPIKSANGYQIRYSLKSNMKSSKKIGTEDVKTTIQKLKKGKRYYIQARMYQIDSVSGKKKYGAWSKIKSITVKK